MARCLKAAPAILLSSTLTGCGGWVHPTRSPGELAYDDASCRQQAVKKVQPSHQKHDAPNWMERSIGTKSYTVDGNDTLREQWHRSCLRVLGWAFGSTASRPGVAVTELIGSGFRYLNP